MKTFLQKLGLLTALFCLLTSGLSLEALAQQPRYNVLVFSKTAGFRHSAIPAGVAAVEALGREHAFDVDATEDASVFDDETLRGYDAVVFLNSTGDALDEGQQAAFERYIRGGGGFVGVHAAADTEYEWPFYGELVGGYFKSHPQQQTATIHVADRAHPATRHLPERWERFDEWYNYRANPRGKVHVLATLDETTYEGGEMGHDHPIAWAHEYEGGRAFYTGLGHTEASYEEPLFLEHLLGGIEWAVGEAEGDVGATQEGAFEKEVLVEDVTDPIELAVAPDGRVFFVERGGAVRVWNPETEATELAGFIPVSNLNEDGLLGVTLDPDFEENGWIYLYYSPEGPEAVNELARFTVRDDRLDPRSKQVLLEVPTQRVECCHTGGSLAFGPDGTLFISTGDNTNPFASDGFAPIDERPGREPWDAQRTSANTMDLRGKILRIRPLPDGTYEIPEDNLFAEGEEGRPEIYTMGHRNPYRITVDPETGYLYWGDVGPDAGAPNETRGPAGLDEVGQAREAGNYGWPLFIGDNKPYHDYDFAEQESGEAFDPARPVNESPNNTGARVLPPAQPALIWYPYGFPEEEAFAEMGAGGRTAMAGPVYHYDPSYGPGAPPASFDGDLFIYEWARNYIKVVRLDDEGDVVSIEPFMPEETFIRPMDMELGPDGRLYVIEWGDEFWGNNDNARIVRLNYYGSEARPPVAVAEVGPTSGPVPLQVRFDATASQARGSDAPLTYAWDFDGDGRIDIGRPEAVYTYEEPGTYTARLTVTGPEGLSDEVEVPITVGNTAPTVAFAWPPHGGIFDFGEPIRYDVEVSDPEDETIEEGRVVVQPYLGRDTHVLPLQPQQGAEGTVLVYPDYGYEYKRNQVVQLETHYADRGAPGVAPQLGRARVVLQPRQKQAEFATELHEATRKTTGNIRTKEDLRTVLEVRDGSYAVYDPVNLMNIDALTLRLKPEAGGTVELRLGGPDGRLLGSAQVDSTADTRPTALAEEEEGDLTTHDEMMHRLREEEASEGWTDVTIPVQDPGGAQALYLVFRGEEEETLMEVDWLLFHGPGIGRR